MESFLQLTAMAKDGGITICSNLIIKSSDGTKIYSLSDKRERLIIGIFVKTFFSVILLTSSGKKINEMARNEHRA